MNPHDVSEADLDLMLASWRDHPAPELADAIDRAAVRVIPSRTDLLTLPKKSVHAVWMALAAKRNAGDLNALLDALTVGTIDEIGARLAELAKWPDDPRLAMAAARLVESVPFQSTSSQKHWTRIFALVTNGADYRTLAVLQRVEKNPVAISGGSMLKWMSSAVSKATRALEEKFSDGPLALSEAQRVWALDAKAATIEAPPASASLFLPPREPTLPIGAPVSDVALPGHVARIVGVAITPDASQLVVSTAEDTGDVRRLTALVRVPDRRTRVVWRAGAGPSPVSPDGRVALCNEGNGTLALRSLESGDRLGAFEVNPGGEVAPFEQVRDCAWSPRADTVALTLRWTYRSFGGVWLVQLADGASRALVKGTLDGQTTSQSPVRAVFSPDGAAVWVLAGKRVSRVDVASGETAVTFAPPVASAWFTALAVDPTGALIATSRQSGEIDLWRADDGAHLGELQGHTGYSLTMMFTPDGAGLVSGATYQEAQTKYDPRAKVSDPIVRFWNAHTRALTGTLDLGAMSVELALSHDARRLVVAREREVVVYALGGAVADGPTPELVETLAQSGFEVSALAFARGADVMVSVAHGGATTVWSTSSGRALGQWEVGALHALAVSPDGVRYATTGGKSVAIRSTRDKRPLGELKGHGKNVYSIAYAHDGKTIATGSDDRTVMLWDAAKHSEIRTLKGHRGRVGALAFTTDGRLLVSAADDGCVNVWEVSTGAMRSECRVHHGVIRAMGIGDDGRVAVVATTDGAALWDLTTSTRRCDLAGHTGPVVGAAMRPDGALAATFGDDRTVRLWRVSDGAEVARLGEWLHTPGILTNTTERWTRLAGALAFSGDGRFLGAGSGREDGGGAVRLLGW